MNQKVSKSKGKGKKNSDHEHFEIQTILKRRMSVNGEEQLLVSWKGLSSHANRWVPRNTILGLQHLNLDNINSLKFEKPQTKKAKAKSKNATNPRPTSKAIRTKARNTTAAERASMNIPPITIKTRMISKRNRIQPGELIILSDSVEEILFFKDQKDQENKLQPEAGQEQQQGEYGERQDGEHGQQQDVEHGEQQDEEQQGKEQGEEEGEKEKEDKKINQTISQRITTRSGRISTALTPKKKIIKKQKAKNPKSKSAPLSNNNQQQEQLSNKNKSQLEKPVSFLDLLKESIHARMIHHYSPNQCTCEQHQSMRKSGVND